MFTVQLRLENSKGIFPASFSVLLHCYLCWPHGCILASLANTCVLPAPSLPSCLQLREDLSTFIPVSTSTTVSNVLSRPHLLTDIEVEGGYIKGLRNAVCWHFPSSGAVPHRLSCTSFLPQSVFGWKLNGPQQC